MQIIRLTPRIMTKMIQRIGNLPQLNISMMQRDSAICSTRATLTEYKKRHTITVRWQCRDSCGARTTAYNVWTLCCIAGGFLG